MPLKHCPKCDRKRRLSQKLEKQKGRMYWIERCVECRTPVTLEPYEKGETKFDIER